MGRVLASFVIDESGATAIEYGLLAALISIAAIAAFQALGLSLITIFTSVIDAITSVFAG